MIDMQRSTSLAAPRRQSGLDAQDDIALAQRAAGGDEQAGHPGGARHALGVPLLSAGNEAPHTSSVPARATRSAFQHERRAEP